jgi:RHS repeat-associated protein
VNTSRNPFPGHSAYIGAAYRPLYNGNISSMGVNIGKLNQPQLYNYEYDQLNRLVSMQAYRGFSGNSWSGITATTDHQESITYDGNGNIVSYLRNGNTSAGKPLAMDNLGYHYKDSAGIRLNNKLRYVTDAVTAVANYTEDIDGQVADNYTYDQIGNLIKDSAEKISNIEWNVYGKIAQIWKDNSSAVGDLQRIAYRYDASGNRISKTVYSNQDASNYKAVHTWYVRDASGNVMATYSSEDIAAKSTLATGTLGKLYLNELHMYGSSRLGIWNRKVDMDVLPGSGGTAPLLGTLGIDTFNRGNKFFELANHLGNVLVTVSDRKVGQNPVSGLYTSYTADVVSASDYAPFGMQMVGRTFSAGAYRYGFNGKENDNEVKGEGNQQDYGMRIYDPRLGKFLSVDPLHNSFPDLTPYQFAGNTPIQAIDLDGGEPLGYLEYWKADKDEYMTKWNFTVQDVYDYQTGQWWTVMRYPNTNEYYYYATKYESAERLFKPKNTDLNKNNGAWTGLFKQFQPRSASELGGKSVDAMLTSFAVGFSAPFVAAGAAITATLAAEQATMAAAQGILAFYRYGPAVGAAGKLVAEFLDESGSVGMSNAAKWSKLTLDEQLVAKTILDQGRNLEILTPSQTSQTADFIIDGITTEVKTLTGSKFNANTAVTKITEAFAQGKNALINARQYDLSAEQVQSIYNRAVGSLKSEGKYVGGVEIWTQNGHYKF